MKNAKSQWIFGTEEYQKGIVFICKKNCRHVLFCIGASETIFEMTIPASEVCVPEVAESEVAVAAALFLPT